MKIILGTAQFGLNYGIANSYGQIDNDEVKKILNFAIDNGINALDTAIGYGNSEECLGQSDLSKWNIITKLPEVDVNNSNINLWVKNQIENSLIRLNLSKIYGILLHKPLQLIEKNGVQLWSCLKSLREQGVVSKIGLSIYSPKELDLLWEAGFLPDIVQAPYNIFDQRIKDSGWLAKLKDNNVEIHTRSVFLQGSLLMSPKQRPKFFNKWKNIFDEWDLYIKNQNISRVEAALNFSLSEDLIDKIIVGVDCKKHLCEVISLNKTNILDIPQVLNCTDEKLINPSLWSI